MLFYFQTSQWQNSSSRGKDSTERRETDLRSERERWKRDTEAGKNKK